MKLYNDDVLVSYLKKVMKEEKISQRKFAKMSGVPRSTVQRIVTGENKLTLDNAIKIAEALGMEIVMIDKEEE
jgi:plasmid maintenance system antidote protein VapI